MGIASGAVVGIVAAAAGVIVIGKGREEIKFGAKICFLSNQYC